MQRIHLLLVTHHYLNVVIKANGVKDVVLAVPNV